MVNRPSQPEIITVNSEELQTTIRDLLPSQSGFGSELQASNVITPIIDLTATAEGSVLRADLQSAIAFGSQTTFSANNSTVVLVSTPGFYRIFGTSTQETDPTSVRSNTFQMSDGISTKNIWLASLPNNTAHFAQFLNFDFVVWLRPGDSISAISQDVKNYLQGSFRQIADGQGTLVPPNGFPL